MSLKGTLKLILFCSGLFTVGFAQSRSLQEVVELSDGLGTPGGWETGENTLKLLRDYRERMALDGGEN